MRISMNKSQSPSPSISKVLADPLLEDLAVLCDGPAVDLRVAFDGALVAMRSSDTLIFQESAGTRWMRLDGAARARLLSGWIHSAALRYRDLHSGHRGSSQGVA